MPVYAGPGIDGGDYTIAGYFQDKQRVHAVCKVSGRNVVENPDASSADRIQSDMWIKIDYTWDMGSVAYASALYAENSQDLLNQTQDC